jgi:hypothetical protein
MRRRFRYANVAATLALVFALSGGAFAASHYLINSTKQINPKVLRKLRGNRGPRGVAGQIGPIGPQGVTGATGPKGSRGPDGEPGFSALSQLPSGKSESGEVGVSAFAKENGETVTTAVTFPIPLTAPIAAGQVEFVTGIGPTKNCAGPGAAAKGWLCVYTNAVDAEKPASLNPEGGTGASGKFGAGLSWKATTEGTVTITGTYTVTAP